MHRFFEDHSSLMEDKILLSADNIHHLNVLRITEDEEFEVVVDGVIYTVKIDEMSKEHCQCGVLSQKEDKSESNIEINLYQGLPKADKLELIIQKAVELGVNSIIPFESSRTIVKWDAKKESKKLVRYQEIAESAAKQSKRSYIPQVEGLISFKQLIEKTKEGYTILAYENRGKSLKEVILGNESKIFNIIIGPEGGFSEDEVIALEEAGAHVINLGARILRTETAAIVLAAMIQYESGDINTK